MFGEHAEGEILVKILEVSATGPFRVGRYRDAWVEAQGDVPTIRVHTRNGGGNRECWNDACDDMADVHVEDCLCWAIASLQAHPWYVRDEDDDFDSTYADFYFVPKGEMGADVLPALVRIAGAPVDMGARWQAAIDAIGGKG
jgi:hypothetical protein